MAVSNKSLGIAAERAVRDALSDDGWWVTKLVENHNGAPFDLLAVKNGAAKAIEVKHVGESRLFFLSRIEDNQRMAYRRWRECGNNDFEFAFFDGTEIFFWAADDVMRAALCGEKTIHVDDASVARVMSRQVIL